MMSRFVHRVFKLGPLMGDLVVSGAGFFVFMRGFPFIVTQQNRSEAEPPMRVADPPCKPLAGIGAALFFFTFVASEALARIGTLRR